MNKHNENKAVIKSISPQRFQPYLSKTGNDPDKAIELYEENLRLSAALYPILSCFEVCMRNQINEVMQKENGVEWLIDPKLLLNDDYKKRIDEVYDRLHEENKIGDDAAENVGRIVAGLSLGFWASLFNNRQEYIFWRPALRHAFPNYNGKLKPLRKRIERIRRLRNRIAHHEPIIFMDDIEGMRDEILEVIGWMCTDTEEWVRGLNR